MRQKRSMSCVPNDILIGQIPLDPRWKFNTRLDVDPYPFRSSCSLYGSGLIQVNMNTSILYLKSATVESFPESIIVDTFPEVHAEYKFRNSPDGYNNTRVSYRRTLYYNRTDYTENFQACSAFIIMMEEFTRENDSEVVGFQYINRLWTLRIPEASRIPYNPDNNNTVFEIVSVPIAVKAYTCKVERVKEGEDGSYNFLIRYIDADVEVSGTIIGRGCWNLAIINGHDTSIYASYLAVKNTQTASIDNVPVQINTS
ncbi:27590_t:CDS:1, partial [Dentiscutata erythropus]